MRPPVPQHVETLTPYVPGKPIEETERELGITGVIKLASNENPLGPSPKAVEALSRSLSSLHLYPDAACFYFKRKLAAFLGLAPEAIVVGNGSNEIIELLIRTFMSDGDEALIAKGSFVMYKVALHAHGKKYAEVPLREYRYDLEAMAERIHAKTRLIFLANPDNPTGSYFARGAFERLLAKAVEKSPDCLVVVDEAYFEYATAADYPNSLTYQRDCPNVVTLRTFSKIYGLAGLRLGFGVMAPVLAGYLNRTRMPFNVTSLAQVGGMAALEDAAHVERTRALARAEIEFVTPALEKLGVRVVPSQTNFIFADLLRPAAPIYEAMLRQGVITRPVPNYGFPNALRITVGTRAEDERMLKAMGEVLGAR
jgi:histidinol-phosphate aminotransferase